MSMLRMNETERKKVQKEISQLITPAEIDVLKKNSENTSDIDSLVSQLSEVLDLFSSIENVFVASQLLQRLSVVDENSVEEFKKEIEKMSELDLILADGTK